MDNRRVLTNLQFSLITRQVAIHGESRNPSREQRFTIEIEFFQQDQRREVNNGTTSEQLNSLSEEKWPGFLYQVENSTPSFLQFKRTKKDCAICLQELEKDDIVRELHCKHIFHKSCIDAWLKNKPSCPLDRNQFMI